MKIRFSINQISFGTLARLCGGELQQLGGREAAVRYICTDSREADAQTAFAALHGEHVDGHDFIDAALENGCPCIICERRNEKLASTKVAVIVVNNTELALARLANGYRSYLRSQRC